MHQTTHHSFSFSFFVWKFFFFYKSSSKILHSRFCPFLFFSTTRQSAFIPGLIEAQDMVQSGMLWLEHTPPTSCRARSTRKLVRTRHIPTHSYRPLKGASSCAGPGGLTWRNTWRWKQGEERWKQGQKGATEAVKRDQRLRSVHQIAPVASRGPRGEFCDIGISCYEDWHKRKGWNDIREWVTGYKQVQMESADFFYIVYSDFEGKYVHDGLKWGNKMNRATGPNNKDNLGKCEGGLFLGKRAFKKKHASISYIY